MTSLPPSSVRWSASASMGPSVEQGNAPSRRGDRPVTPSLVELVDRQIESGPSTARRWPSCATARPWSSISPGDAAPGLPAGPSVLWPLASITKLYTAAAVMRLVELGELTVNTPVWQILPDFTGDGPRGRPRPAPPDAYLRAALRVARDGRPAGGARVHRRPDRRGATRRRCCSRPATRFQYSDYAYGLAGRVASVVAGAPFPDARSRRWSSSRWASPTRSCARPDGDGRASRRSAACSTTAPTARCTTRRTGGPRASGVLGGRHPRRCGHVPSALRARRPARALARRRFGP